MEILVTRTDPDELYHYGVKGMKWGKRKVRYESVGNQNTVKSVAQTDEQKLAQSKARTKKAITIGAAAVGTTLAVYGVYKVSKLKKQNAEIGKQCVDHYLNTANRYASSRTSDGIINLVKSGKGDKVYDLENKLTSAYLKEASTRGKDLREITKKTSIREAYKNVRDFKRGEDITKRYMKNYGGKNTFEVTYDVIQEINDLLGFKRG